MSKASHNIFICTNQRPAGHPQRFLPRKQRHCSYGEMGMAIEQKGLFGQILIINTSFMGPCLMGPVMVVYPDGAW